LTDQPIDRVAVAASPEAIWSVLEDPVALGRVLPGCESLVRDGPDRFTAVIASKVQFMTIRSDVVASLLDADRPRHLRLVLDGRPRGLGGSFRLDVPFDIVRAPDGRSEVSYQVRLELGGSLAGFGGAMLTETLRRQIGELVQNLDRELAAHPPAAPSDADQDPAAERG
jgi:2-furoyl-CoA dehydrogenase large subunit